MVQLLGPQQASSNHSGCSALKHLLLLQDAELLEGTGGGREPVPPYLPKQGQQGLATGEPTGPAT